MEKGPCRLHNNSITRTESRNGINQTKAKNKKIKRNEYMQKKSKEIKEMGQLKKRKTRARKAKKW